MAWRLENYLVRGEIDNRIRDRVTGRLWFAGREEPVELELYGNTRRDLAGKRLEFFNSSPQAGLDASFSTQQIGVVSEMTASRKVRVPDIQLNDDIAHGQYHASVSWHGGNAIYLEWFSLASGRVIIESTEYKLTLDPDTCWDMTAEEESLQRVANSRAIELFNREIEFLATSETAASADSADEVTKPVDNETVNDSWADETPLSESEADELMADSDRLTERLMERIEEAGEDADLEAILEEELERRRKEASDRSPSSDEEMKMENWSEEANQIVEENSPNRGFETALPSHPLAEKARALTVRVVSDVELNRWSPPTPGMHPVVDLVSSVAKAGGKLAGALNSREWPLVLDECGLCLASLKQACRFLSDANVAADFCRETNLVPPVWLRNLQRELDELRDEASEIIADLRDRLERGFD